MKVLALLFAYGQSSHGVATPIRDAPRDDLSIRKSNGAWHSASRFGRGLPISCSHAGALRGVDLHAVSRTGRSCRPTYSCFIVRTESRVEAALCYLFTWRPRLGCVKNSPPLSPSPLSPSPPSPSTQITDARSIKITREALPRAEVCRKNCISKG